MGDHLATSLVVLAVIATVSAACASPGPDQETSPPTEQLASPTTLVADASNSAELPVDASNTEGLPSDAALCSNTPPSSAPGTSLEEARLALDEDMRATGGEYWSGYAVGPTTNPGRIEIRIATRDSDIIQHLIDITDPELVCFILPPPGYDNLPPEPARWAIVQEVQPEDTTIATLIDDIHLECGHAPQGRILLPQVTYGSTSIDISIELTPIELGRDYECGGWVPESFTIELTEPIGERTITGDFLVDNIHDR